MSDQPETTTDEETDDDREVGKDPKHPHPQDRPSSRGKTDDDSPVDRYRDSPGRAVSEDGTDVPEPNEPG